MVLPTTFSMSFFLFILGALSVWRLTHLFYAEDGPWDLLVRLRSRAGRGFWGGLLDCFYCLSLWIAIPFVFLLGENWRQRVLLWPALSASAIIIQRIAFRDPAPTTVEYFEQKEEQSDVLLRSKESEISRPDVGSDL